MPDERTIIERTRARYERDGRIPHPTEIAVSEKAGAVTVRGTVATPHQRQAAIHVARSVPGVTFVSDELVLDPRDRTADAELRGAASQAVMVNPELAERVDVTVHDVWLTLKGEVIRIYQPSTRPGSPLPHAWIDDEDGSRRPIKDLVTPGRFLLIAGEHGEAWCDAARELAADAGIPLDAVRIGHVEGDLYDPRLAWVGQRQITPDGAVLVRPDRHIGWRSVTAADDPLAALAEALGQILARPVTSSVATGARA